MGADGNTINGGNGVTYWDVTYGGGGVGIDRVNPGTGTPGTGGGGDEGQDGTDGLGGGGGAATSSGVQDAGSGGSGVVIIRYLTPVTGPTASFTGTPLSGTAPLTVQFTDSSSNSPTSWSWNFGDSQTSSLQNPSHTYTTAGSYTVSLNATNGDGFDTETKTGYITVSAPATSTVSIVGSGNITQANDYTTLDLTLDYVPLGFSGYNVNITVDNPAIAEITGITFPTWAQDMNTVGSLPGTQNILLKASDVNDNITAGMSNVPLGTITFRGLSYGSTTISLSSANFDDENGYDMPLSLTQGSIFVDEPLADPLIFDITPAQAYNNASVTILLNGTGFLSDMMVVNLTKPGETDITADPVTVPSRFQTNCVFNINGAADGVWNITLMRTSDEKTTTFLNGFTVVRPLIPIDGMTHDPTDLNEDGKYEDLNGNGQLDYADVNLFAHVILNGWIFENEPVELFDFSGNGSLTYEDVITLFLMVS